jgi:Zn-dependent peptidase ImmA (M78 family)
MNKPNIIREVRAIAPLRPLTLTEAFEVAERQATTLLELLAERQPAVNVGKIADLPKIEVQTQPRYRMPTLAGFSQWLDGRWLIVVNRDSVPGRRRFTLAHEFKHVLDHPGVDVTYRDLGRGDSRKHDQQIETICNHFAACVLMPRAWIKRAWSNGIQEEEALAGLFNVSVEAMHTRLVYLGYIGDDRRPVASYFRTDLPLLSRRTGTSLETV